MFFLILKRHKVKGNKFVNLTRTATLADDKVNYRNRFNGASFRRDALGGNDVSLFHQSGHGSGAFNVFVVRWIASRSASTTYSASFSLNKRI